MAKIKSIFSKGTGSIGSVTLQVNKGQQIAKSKITNMTNPRTRAQMVQRLRWANVVLMWKLSILSFLKGFFFKKQTWSWFNAFMSINVKAPAVYLPKNYATRNACVVAPYYVSDGNLESITPLLEENISAGTNMIMFNVNLGSSVTETIKSVSTALLATVPTLRVGDALCFMALEQTFDDEGYCHVKVHRAKLIIDITDTRNLTEIGLVLNTISGTTTQNKLALEFVAGGEFAYTIVHTRKSGSKLDVSRQQLIMNNTTDPWYLNFTGEEGLERALSTYNGDASEVFYEPASGGGGSVEPIVPEP